MKVVNQLMTYTSDDYPKETGQNIEIVSHSNKYFVTIQINKQEISLRGSDLLRAVNNICETGGQDAGTR